jgi:hypothetical protein
MCNNLLCPINDINKKLILMSGIKNVSFFTWLFQVFIFYNLFFILTQTCYLLYRYSDAYYINFQKLKLIEDIFLQYQLLNPWPRLLAYSANSLSLNYIPSTCHGLSRVNFFSNLIISHDAIPIRAKDQDPKVFNTSQ